MKTVKVTYTVKPAFVHENQKNINIFMEELRRINDPDLRYIAYLCGDGKTFMHIAAYQNDESQKMLLELESFKSFQQKRDESGLEVAPQIEVIEPVAASYSVFN